MCVQVESKFSDMNVLLNVFQFRKKKYFSSQRHRATPFVNRRNCVILHCFHIKAVTLQESSHCVLFVISEENRDQKKEIEIKMNTLYNDNNGKILNKKISFPTNSTTEINYFI